MIAIIADDLTGASDCGVQLVREGILARVQLETGEDQCAPEPGQATIFDTNSRALPQHEAYRKLFQLTQYLKQQPGLSIYKKIDSTLRGNLGAEIDAVMSYGFAAAIIAPAYPANGRQTIDGMQHVEGVPVHETESSQDPIFPVHDSRISELLRLQTARRTILIPLKDIRSGRFTQLVEEVIMHNPGALLVCDAATDDDLSIIAELYRSSSNRLLWVGSAGLAGQLPWETVYPGSITAFDHEANQSHAADKQIMIVAGSLSAKTMQQAASIHQHGSVTTVAVNGHAIIANSADRQLEELRCFHLLAEAILKKHDVLLQINSTNKRDAAASPSLSDALGRIAAAVRSECSSLIDAIVLTGGDTARAVCHHMGIQSLQLVEEIEPGVVLSQTSGPNPLKIVTKAGAFGDSSTFIRTINYLRRERMPC